MNARLAIIKQKIAPNKDILIHTLISFFLRILGASSAFLVSILIARKLGANDAGVYFLAFSIISFLAAIARIGSDNTLLRNTGRSTVGYDIAKNTYQKSILSTAIIGTILIVFIAYNNELIATKFFNKVELQPVLLAMAPGILGLSLLTLSSISFQGMKKYAASIFFLNLFINIFLASYVLFNDKCSTEQVATIFSISSIIGFLLCFILLSTQFNKKQTNETIKWATFLTSCAPMFLIMLMNQIIQWSSQFISGLWVSNSDIAILAVSQRTALLTSFILTAVNLVVAPKFAELHHQNKLKELENLAIFSVKMMSLASLPLAIILLIFPSYVLSIFGSEFQSGENVLRVIVIGQLINVLTGSVGYLLSMSGHEKDLRNSVFVCGLLILALNFILIPIWGIMGAAISIAIALSCQNLLAVYYVKKRLGFNTLNLKKLLSF